ncbi:MAG TPA: hypothetical protein VND68_05095 [Chloroflexia bacterium]|nr:hypothetical protein [Chloroflexia bacterium]
MYIAERDAYAEAHRGPSGCAMWLVWLAWVVVSVFTFTLGESLGRAVENLLAPEMMGLRRALSIEQRVAAGGSLNLFASMAGGLVAGVVFAVGQGLVLLPFLKVAGALEWVVATTIGRAIGWVAIYGLSKELVRIVLQKDLTGVCLLVVFLGGMGVITGLALGYPQAMILRRRIQHPVWWVFSNIPGPVAAALLISAALYVETSNTVRDFSSLVVAAVTAAVTGMALMDLLRSPTTQAEWLSGSRWRKERSKAPQADTVLGSSLYGAARPAQAATGSSPATGEPAARS